MPLPIKARDGSVFVEVDGTPVSWNAGWGYAASGRLCVTDTEGANDAWLGGIRLDPQGRVVCGNGIGAARPYVYVRGLPTDKRNGKLIRQINQTPAPTDPFVVGIRVGPNGGVYMGEVDPPLPVNTSPPVVTGIPQSSNKLTCDPGTWTDADAIAFQWYKDGLPIIGQTGSQLTLNSTYIGSVVRCDVTGSNEVGSDTAQSNDTTIIP
jgi:hypothetical protein